MVKVAAKAKKLLIILSFFLPDDLFIKEVLQISFIKLVNPS